MKITPYVFFTVFSLSFFQYAQAASYKDCGGMKCSGSNCKEAQSKWNACLERVQRENEAERQAKKVERKTEMQTRKPEISKEKQYRCRKQKGRTALDIDC